MASPTFAEAATQLKNAVKVWSDLYASVTTAVSGNIDTMEQALEGDYLPGALTAFGAAIRNRVSAAIDPGAVRAIWNAWAAEVAKLAGLPELDFSSADHWARVSRYVHEQSESFNDRNITRGTPSAGGGNVGDGTLTRLTVDWEGYNLQAGHIETKRVECVRDQNLGAQRFAEVFEYRGGARSKDLLSYSGSGLVQLATCIHEGPGGAASLLQNPSWDSAFNGSGSDKIPGWTIGGTAGDVTADTATFYRIAPGASSGQGLQIAAGTGEVTQALSVRRLNALGERVPWGLQVAFKKTGSGDTGTLTLKCGNKSQAFDLSTYVNTTWNIARLDMDKDLYYRNWREDQPDIEVEWASTSAVLYLDTLLFAPLIQYDGTWSWLVSGATPFIQRDFFTIADTGGAIADAEMMFAAWWAGVPVNLPVNNSAAETITDP